MDSLHRSREARQPQAIRELLRMVRAVIRDGRVTSLEAEFLRFWFDEHAQLLETPPLAHAADALRHLAEGESDVDAPTLAALTRLTSEYPGL